MSDDVKMMMKYKEDNFDKHVELYRNDKAQFSIAISDCKEHGWGKTEWKQAVKDKAKELDEIEKEEEKKKRQEEREERRKEKIKEAENDLPIFDTGDYAEMALRMCMIISGKSGGEPVATHNDKIWRYDAEYGRWKMITDNDLSCSFQNWSGRAYTYSDKGKIVSVKINNVSTPIKMMKSLPNRKGWNRGEIKQGNKVKSWLSTGPIGVAFRDKFVTAKPYGTGFDVQVIDKSPENRSRFGYDFDYGKTTGPGVFLEFIDQVFDGAPDKEERIQLVKEYLGCCLLGLATKMNKALILYGPPGTGKGSLLKIAGRCMPDQASAVQPKDWDDPQFLAQLADTRLNVINEISYHDIKDANAIKRIISGDMVTGKNVYEKPFQFEPECGHVITSNEGQLPSVGNADLAFWDRFVCVPMENRFRDTGQERRGIADAVLREDVEGVVRWMIEGAIQATQRGGFVDCPSGERVIDEWRGTVNSAAQFISECTVNVSDTAASNIPTVTEVYRVYQDWCKMVGYRKPVSRSKFTSQVKQMDRFKKSNGQRFIGEVKKDVRSEIDESKFNFGRG